MKSLELDGLTGGLYIGYDTDNQLVLRIEIEEVGTGICGFNLDVGQAIKVNKVINNYLAEEIQAP